MENQSVNWVQTASLLVATEVKVLQRDRLVNNNRLTGVQ